jgi:hypothetical protein
MYEIIRETILSCNHGPVVISNLNVQGVADMACAMLERLAAAQEGTLPASLAAQVRQCNSHTTGQAPGFSAIQHPRAD